MAENNVTNLETKSIIDGFKAFGKPTQPVSQITCKKSDGTTFKAPGQKLATCMVMFSKKFTDRLAERHVNVADAILEVATHPEDYQFVKKPNGHWKDGSPIWQLTTGGAPADLIGTEQQFQNGLAALNALIG